MDLDAALRGRRSIRHHLADPVPDELLLEMIDLARHAPSSMDAQPWQFVIVRDAALRRELAAIKTRHAPPEKSAYPTGFVADAPASIVICVESARAHGRGLESAVLATANLLLAAHARGLGAVFLSAQRPGNPELGTEIARALGLPSGLEPVTIVPLGRPGEGPRRRTLRPLTTLVHHDRFGHRAD